MPPFVPQMAMPPQPETSTSKTMICVKIRNFLIIGPNNRKLYSLVKNNLVLCSVWKTLWTNSCHFAKCLWFYETIVGFYQFNNQRKNNLQEESLQKKLSTCGNLCGYQKCDQGNLVFSSGIQMFSNDGFGLTAIAQLSPKTSPRTTTLSFPETDLCIIERGSKYFSQKLPFPIDENFVIFIEVMSHNSESLPEFETARMLSVIGTRTPKLWQAELSICPVVQEILFISPPESTIKYIESCVNENSGLFACTVLIIEPCLRSKSFTCPGW